MSRTSSLNWKVSECCLVRDAVSEKLVTYRFGGNNRTLGTSILQMYGSLVVCTKASKPYYDACYRSTRLTDTLQQYSSQSGGPRRLPLGNDQVDFLAMRDPFVSDP